MKKDWEEIIITKTEAYRSCFTQYYSNKKGYEKISHSSFDKSRNLLNDCYRLDQIPLSKEKLIEIGITKKIELDFSIFPKKTIVNTKPLDEKKDRSKKLSRLLRKDLVSFFDELSKSPEQETSLGSEEKTHCTSRLASASIFGEPSAGASSAESETASDQKLMDKLTL